MRTPPIAFKANTPGLHSHSNLLEAKLRSTSPKPQKIDSAPLTNRAPSPERKISASTNNIYTPKKDATFAIPILMPLSQPTARDSGNGLNNSLGESSKIKVPSNRDFGAQDSSAITLEVEMGPIPQVRDMKSTGQAEESKNGDALTKTAEGEEKAICHAENVNDTNGDDESEIFFDASMNGGNSETSPETNDGTASQTVPHLSTTNTDGTFATFNSKELYYASQPPANPQEAITSENNDSTIIENDAQPVNATDILDNSDENKVPIAVFAVLVEETTKEVAYEILSGSTSLSKLSKDVGLPLAEKVSIADSTSPAEPATMTGTSVMVSSSEQLVQEKTEAGRQVHPQNPLLGSGNALGTSLAPKNESTTSDNSLREGVVNGRSSSSLIGSTKPAVPATRPQQRVTPEKGRVVATTAPAISAAPPQTVEAAAPVKEIPPYMLPRALPESTAPMFMWRPNATLSEPRRKKKIVVKEVEQKQTFWTRLTGRGKKETEVEGAKKKSGQKSKGRNDDSDSYSDSSSDSESDESTSSYEDSNSSDSSAASGRNDRSRRKHSRGRSEKVQNVKKKEGADVERSKSDRGDRRSKKEEKGDKIVRKSRSAGHRNDDRDGRKPRSRQSSTEREGKNRSSKEKVGRSKSDRGERKPKREGTERRSKSARSRGDDKSSRSHRSSDERESGKDTARTETPKREPDGYQPLPKSETVLKGDGGVSNSRGALATSSSANPHQNNNMPEKKSPAPPMLFVERPMLETLIPVDLILEDQQIEVPVQNLDDPVLLIMTSCFPEEDASLLHSILEGHEFDLEKSIAACRSYGFTEKTSAIQNALAPREPANIGIDTSVKLMRLHGNFPELTKDVLSGVLFAHKGDVNSAEAYLRANGENMNFHRVAPPAMPLSTETRKDPINGEEAPHNSNRIIPLAEIRDEDVEEDLT